MREIWGYHLLLDGSGGDMAAVTSKDIVRAFSKALVIKIDMIPFGEPWVEHFATHEPDKAGVSLVQLIETSNITAHFVDVNGDFFIDVFSCKPYDPQDVITLVHEYFKPTLLTDRFMHRYSTPIPAPITSAANPG